ncbi:MAG TPA: hypothetical protein VGG40_09305 [Solirubrobacterales bacterium]
MAGIGGFSGRESSLSAEWPEERIAGGQIRWILSGGSGPGGQGGGALGGPMLGSTSPTGGDSRTGSASALTKVVETCEAATSSALESSAATL